MPKKKNKKRNSNPHVVTKSLSTTIVIYPNDLYCSNCIVVHL